METIRSLPVYLLILLRVVLCVRASLFVPRLKTRTTAPCNRKGWNSYLFQEERFSASPSARSPFPLYATSGDSEKGKSQSKNRSRRKKISKPKPSITDSDAKTPSNPATSADKAKLMKAVGERIRSSKQPATKDEGFLDKLNPFKAGQNLRKTIDTAITSISSKDAATNSIYYMDDRFANTIRSDDQSLLDRLSQEDYVPEVLVVGATTEVGRLVVQRLLLEGRFRVRVLVNDLYTKTLNMLGTGVTYCQGDLSNIDSLEFAVTDVDKIVFCSSPPRPDEEQFVSKFSDFVKETLDSSSNASLLHKDLHTNDVEWEQLESVLKVRAQLAEQVDCLGLKNLVQAFQNVRHADYGTSQAVKRSLFKFGGRPEDFNLFSLDEDKRSDRAESESDQLDHYEESFTDEYDDVEEDDYLYEDEMVYEGVWDGIEKRTDSSFKVQTQWLRNRFGHGVLVGRVPKGSATGKGGGEASVVSSRLRSRQDPEKGIDLGTGFAGFICRLCSDGSNYEAFVRTETYYEDGIEYVCPFETATKSSMTNKSRNKFTTVRLPFESFKPVQRVDVSNDVDLKSVRPFSGYDVRDLGFRYRASDNPTSADGTQWSNFYLALDYIKLYRSQPEPEFVYVSDAQIPPVVRIDMVQHEARQLLVSSANGKSEMRLLDDSTLQSAARGRSSEEVYYKYRGEEILKKSGLNYSIARVAGFNEEDAAETSSIDISSSNDNVEPVSRAEAAQVCVSALLDPCALNKSFYITKKKGSNVRGDEDMKSKFAALPGDAVVS